MCFALFIQSAGSQCDASYTKSLKARATRMILLTLALRKVLRVPYRDLGHRGIALTHTQRHTHTFSLSSKFLTVTVTYSLFPSVTTTVFLSPFNFPRHNSIPCCSYYQHQNDYFHKGGLPPDSPYLVDNSSYRRELSFGPKNAGIRAYIPRCETIPFHACKPNRLQLRSLLSRRMRVYVYGLCLGESLASHRNRGAVENQTKGFCDMPWVRFHEESNYQRCVFLFSTSGIRATSLRFRLGTWCHLIGLSTVIGPFSVILTSTLTWTQRKSSVTIL